MYHTTYQRSRQQRHGWLLLVAACLISAAAAASEPSSQASGPGGMTVNVSNGYELHAALTSTDVDTIVLLEVGSTLLHPGRW
jgi:hypothetical protein